MRGKSEKSFEHFYYTKVGLGEGCGCAERVIDVHEFERLAGKPKTQEPAGAAQMRRMIDRLAGLFRRRSQENLPK